MRAPGTRAISLAKIFFAFPGNLDTPTGGYAYDRRLIAELSALGRDVIPLSVPGNYPSPSDTDLDEARRLFGSLPAGACVLVDGLMFGVLPPSLLQAAPCRWMALVHHPLALETGLTLDRADALRASERMALAFAEMVIVTSVTTADLLCTEYGVPREHLTVARPGQEPKLRAQGSHAESLSLLSVGSVVARKGYPDLVAALAQLTDLPWRCRIVGASDRDPREFERVRVAIARLGLESRVILDGVLDQAALAEAYDRADLYVSSAFYEGYGMALADAVAHGLPIVAYAGGAVAATMPTGAGRLVPVGNETALAAAIGEMIRDPSARLACADASWRAAANLPSWRETAALVAAAVDRLM